MLKARCVTRAVIARLNEDKLRMVYVDSADAKANDWHHEYRTYQKGLALGRGTMFFELVAVVEREEVTKDT